MECLCSMEGFEPYQKVYNCYKLLTMVTGGVKRREDMQNTRAHETTRLKIQRTKNCPEKY